jgi:hypothetical protein
MNIMKYKQTLFTLFFSLSALFLLSTCVPLEPTGGQSSGSGASAKRIEKEFRTEDYVYEDRIKTVLLYPNTYSSDSNNIGSPPALQPAVQPINKINQFLLEFDELGTDYQNYYAKIINCNADWTVSSLNAVQYMDAFNEIFITDRKASYATRMPYIHYKFLVPKVKQSGNYVLMVYRNSNSDDIILTRRFMITDNMINIQPQIKFSSIIDARNFNQQVDFVINYPNMDIVNPLLNLKVSVRQNFRFDNAINDLKPVFIKEDEKTLEYLYFDLQNNFLGGNEFRIFDIRSAKFNGINVDRVVIDSAKAEEFLSIDKSRNNKPYGLTIDKNGRYYIQLYETGNTETEPDYVYVDFFLDVPKEDGRIFIIGALTDWKLKEDFELVYNEKKQIYTCRTLLKQGYYNYKYVYLPNSTKKPDEVYFEGTSNLAGNNYDIIAYYRPVGARSDLIIGYNSTVYPQ